MRKTFDTILRLRRGSHTYGTATPDSDEDYLEIVIPHGESISAGRLIAFL